MEFLFLGAAPHPPGRGGPCGRPIPRAESNGSVATGVPSPVAAATPRTLAGYAAWACSRSPSAFATFNTVAKLGFPVALRAL